MPPFSPKRTATQRAEGAMKAPLRFGCASTKNTKIYYTVTSRGGVAEWLKAAVLKTVEPQGSVGSNPTASAI